MSLWVKICGNTSQQDAEIAVDAGADALGFIFAPSPRQTSIVLAAAIIARLPRSVEKIGVFVDASLEKIIETVRSTGLTGVQLHFNARSDLPARLKTEFGETLRIVQVVHFNVDSAESFSQRFAACAGAPHLDGLLVDSRTPFAVGGTGLAFDWVKAHKTLAAAPHHKLIAAGGLTPTNVAEAIATLRPWGVDVVSGVESEPGHKSAAKVRQFIANARLAHQALYKQKTD